MRQVGHGRETPFIWMRRTAHPRESHHRETDPYGRGHCVLRISVLGVSTGLCSFLLGRFPPDLPPPGPEGGRAGLPPPALHPPGRIHHCRSEWWLALGNWPALFPQNSANILDALKWVNKVLQDAETQRPPLIQKFVGHPQAEAVKTDTYKHTHTVKEPLRSHPGFQFRSSQHL